MRATRSSKTTESEKKRCVVRLEKVKSNIKADEEKRSKLSGPLKKRPILTKQKNMPRQVVQRDREEEAVIDTLSSSRSRRTPKPNPKYNNADLVTSRSIRKIRELESEPDDDNDDEDDDDSAVVSSADSVEEDDDSPDFESEDEIPAKKAKIVRKSIVVNRSPVVQVKHTPKPKSVLQAMAMANKSMRSVQKPSPPAVNSISKTQRLSDKAIELALDRSSPAPAIRRVPLRSKTAQEKLPQRLTAAAATAKSSSNPISIDDAIQRECAEILEKTKRKINLDKERKNAAESSIIERNRRLNIELYDSNMSASPAAVGTKSAKSPLHNARLQMKSALNSSTSKSRENVSLKESDERSQPDIEEDIMKPANTQDDFETMPTFTIVNVNDIINKKGDVIIGNNKNETGSSVSKNRRKTGHTTILSDKIDPSAPKPSPQERTPFPPPQPKKTMTILNNNHSAKIAKSVERVVVEKPPPRILNSTLCKKAQPVTPMISKCNTEPKILNNSQQSNKPVSPATKLSPGGQTQKKLPSEKISIQRQGNRIIKKITCFETWYVINIPPDAAVDNSKNKLEMPLVKVGNAAKVIVLPSDNWTFKVTLQAVPDSALAKSSFEKYTGDLQDVSIPDEDRDKYQPSCVMFRRCSTLKDKARLPYDRAVIFKNKTFFMNIDGRNVKLVGAPLSIRTLEEIETLLQLVDELPLNSPYVEATSTI